MKVGLSLNWVISWENSSLRRRCGIPNNRGSMGFSNAILTFWAFEIQVPWSPGDVQSKPIATPSIGWSNFLNILSYRGFSHKNVVNADETRVAIGKNPTQGVTIEILGKEKPTRKVHRTGKSSTIIPFCRADGTLMMLRLRTSAVRTEGKFGRQNLLTWRHPEYQRWSTC